MASSSLPAPDAASRSTRRSRWQRLRVWALLGILLSLLGVAALVFRSHVRFRFVQHARTYGFVIEQLEGFELVDWFTGWTERPRIRVRRLVARHVRAPRARLVATGVVSELDWSNLRGLGPQEQDQWSSHLWRVRPSGCKWWDGSGGFRIHGRSGIRSLTSQNLLIEAVGPSYQAWRDLFLVQDALACPSTPFDHHAPKVALRVKLSEGDPPLFECTGGWIHALRGATYERRRVHHQSLPWKGFSARVVVPRPFDPGRCVLFGEPLPMTAEGALDLSKLLMPRALEKSRAKLSACLWLETGTIDADLTLSSAELRQLFPAHAASFPEMVCPTDDGHLAPSVRLKIIGSLGPDRPRPDEWLKIIGSPEPDWPRLDAWLCGYTPPLPGELALSVPPPRHYGTSWGGIRARPSGDLGFDVKGAHSLSPQWSFRAKGTLEIGRHGRRFLMRMPGYWPCGELWRTVQAVLPGSPAANAAKSLLHSVLQHERAPDGLRLQVNLVVDLDDLGKSSLRWFVEPGCGLEGYPLELWKYPPLPADYPYDPAVFYGY